MDVLIPVKSKHIKNLYTLVDKDQAFKLKGKTIYLPKRANRVVVFVYNSETQHTAMVSITSFLFGRPKKGLEWDHIDGNIFDNRRKNLRLATRRQNAANTRKPRITSKGRKPTSQYKGVCFVKARKHLDTPWIANICIDWRANKQKYLGYFASEEEAYEAYKKAAIELHGEFAKV